MNTTLKNEILERLGVASNFFLSEGRTAEVSAGLWAFARFAYLDNPLPALFKERIAASLSRYCEARYCLARHAAFLTGRGNVAGDPHCAPQTVPSVLGLLRRPFHSATNLRSSLGVLAASDGPMAELPGSDTPQEQALLACITHIFLHTENVDSAREALRRALGPARLEFVNVLLAFIEASHSWSRTHPEIVFEDDVNDLLATHEALAAWVLDDPAALAAARGSARRGLTRHDTARRFGCRGEVSEDAHQPEIFMTGACVDVTDRKISDECIPLGEQRYRDVIDSIDEAFAIAKMIEPTDTTGIDFLCVEANPAFNRLSMLDDSVGTTLRQVIPHIEDVWIARYVRVLRTGEPIRFQERVASVNKWYDVFASRFGGAGSRRIAVLFTDITARKQAEAALHDSVEHIAQQARIFDTTLSSITDFAYIFDKNGRFIYSNQALLDLLGITFEQIVGKDFFELGYPDELAQKLQSQIRHVIETKLPLTDETPFTSATGVHGDYEYIFSPVISGDGTVEVVAGSTRNITRRRAMERALKDSEERSRGILESITDGFMALDAAWRITYVNPQAERLLTRPSGRLIGKVLWEIYPGLAGSAFEKTYRNVARDQKAAAVTAFYGDHKSWYEAHVYPATDGITVYFSDVTERVSVQEALRSAKDDLEMRVVERTDELQKANASLRSEISERKRAEAERLELLQKLVNAQEEERRRISRELHDSLGQHLTALTFGLKTMAKEPARQEPVWIGRLLETTLRLDEELERLAHELRPPALDDLGLDAALQRHIASWSQQSGISVDAQTRGIEGARLPGPIESTVYRIAQEALTNIQKHARATQVSLIAERRNRELRVVIEDNGAGFEPDRILSDPNARRLGLRGMAERAALVAGKLEVESRPGQGAAIYLSIPLDDGAMESCA